MSHQEIVENSRIENVPENQIKSFEAKTALLAENSQESYTLSADIIGDLNFKTSSVEFSQVLIPTSKSPLSIAESKISSNKEAKGFYPA